MDASLRHSVLRETLRLGVPATLATLSQWLLALADTYMVGRLGLESEARGMAAIANVHIGGMYILAMVITFAALAVGTQAVAARRWGEGNRPRAAAAMIGGLVIAVGLSVILLPLFQVCARPLIENFSGARGAIDTGTVHSYLSIRLWALPAMLMLFVMRGWFNGVGHTSITLASVGIVNGLNILLNWAWIEGRWGFERLEESGAALASSVSTWIGLGHLLLHCLFARRWRAIHLLRRWVFDTELIGRIARLSIPSFIHLAAAHIGFLIFLGFIVPRTRESMAGVAASGIVWNTASVCFFVSLGFGIAAGTMLGQGLGSGELRRAVRGVWTACFLAMGINLAIAIILCTLGRQIVACFNRDPEVIRLGFWLFVIVASFQFIDAFGIVLAEAFKGAGMTLFIMLVEVPMNLAMFLGLSWWWGIGLGWGVIGAWAPLILYALLFGTIMIVAFRAGLWRRGRA